VLKSVKIENFFQKSLLDNVFSKVPFAVGFF